MTEGRRAHRARKEPHGGGGGTCGVTAVEPKVHVFFFNGTH